MEHVAVAVLCCSETLLLVELLVELLVQEVLVVKMLVLMVMPLSLSFFSVKLGL